MHLVPDIYGIHLFNGLQLLACWVGRKAQMLPIPQALNRTFASLLFFPAHLGLTEELVE